MKQEQQQPPLAGMKVLDFTEYGAGPFCTMLLADLGADVIKVERPTGDGFRSWAAVEGETGTAFSQLNRNKRSVVLDMKAPSDRRAAKAIAAKVDVLVENYRPGVMESAGLSYAAMHEANPALIYCSISGFGQTGPFKDRGGFDLVLQGQGGLMSVTGEPGGSPTKSGVPIIDFGASANAAIGILAAWIAKGKTGLGQHVDVALLDVPVSWLGLLAAKFWATGEVQRATGSAHFMSAPYQAFRTKDGYITIAAGNQELWVKTCRACGLQHLIADLRFADNNARARNQEALCALIEDVLTKESSAHWIEFISASGIPCGPINSVDEVLVDPQVLHRNMVVEMKGAKGNAIKMIGSPIKLSGTPTVLDRAPPALGEHTSEVLEEFGLSIQPVN
jgi:crotonobetainyl-CoA:carnitine CoA-transferase CaiB-like acyl-CoA transferase